MDSQRRVQLLKSLRDLTKTDFNEPVALCLEDDHLFFLINTNQLTDDHLVVDVVKLDEKGRFVFPLRLMKHYKIPETAQEFVFVQGKKIFISFDT